MILVSALETTNIPSVQPWFPSREVREVTTDPISLGSTTSNTISCISDVHQDIRFLCVYIYIWSLVIDMISYIYSIYGRILLFCWWSCSTGPPSDHYRFGDANIYAKIVLGGLTVFHSGLLKWSNTTKQIFGIQSWWLPTRKTFGATGSSSRNF